MSLVYTPTPGPLPGEQYCPSNGTDGACFHEEFCCRCARDKCMSEGKDFDACTEDEVCQILGASFRGEAVEWRELDDGSVTCIAFVPVGERIPGPRCAKTADLFGDGAA